MAARLALLAIAAAVALIAAVVHHGGSDGDGDGAVASAQRHSAYLGPRRASQSWIPSRSKPMSIVWAIGDGADGGPDSRAVAAMVGAQRVDRLLYLGDVYETGTASEFQTNYAPPYHRFDPITAPTIGNHEWASIANGYVPYWTAVRGT